MDEPITAKEQWDSAKEESQNRSLPFRLGWEACERILLRENRVLKAKVEAMEKRLNEIVVAHIDASPCSEGEGRYDAAIEIAFAGSEAEKKASG